MYSPVLGRFQSRDPLPLAGEPDIMYGNRWIRRNVSATMNLYLYVESNPTNLIDASGLAPEDSKLLQIQVTVKPKLTGSCGGVAGSVTYIIAPADVVKAEPIIKLNLSGTVIQHITYHKQWFECIGPLQVEQDADYFEGFPVKGSIPQTDRARKNTMVPWGFFSDTLEIYDQPGTRGSAKITGCVAYMPDYDIINRFPPWQEEDKVTPPLPVKTTGVPVLIGKVPVGFDKLTPKCRSLTIEWNCCSCPPKEPTATSSGWDDDKKQAE